MLRWRQDIGVKWHYTSPASRSRTLFNESFNQRLRDELLRTLRSHCSPYARAALNAWQIDYNTVRPHSSLGNLPPGLAPSSAARHLNGEGAARNRLRPPRCSSNLWGQMETALPPLDDSSAQVKCF
jgi:putative transposase